LPLRARSFQTPQGDWLNPSIYETEDREFTSKNL